MVKFTPRKAVRGVLVGLATGALMTGVAAGTASAATVHKGGFGPRGYEGVTLGMSAKQAKATRKLAISHGGRCVVAPFKDQPSGAAIISAKYGVELIVAPAKAKTPRGIGDGSSWQQVKRAYPNLKWVGDPYGYKIQLSRDSFYRLGFVRGSVVGLQLQLKTLTADCFE